MMGRHWSSTEYGVTEPNGYPGTSSEIVDSTPKLSFKSNPRADSALFMASVRHRIHEVVDSKLKRGGCIMHGPPAFIEPLPELADVVVIVQDHLEVAVGISKAKELDRTLPRKNISR